MNRYLKYGLIILLTLCIIGLVFYLLNKPNVSVVKNIPADSDFCITFNKSEVIKENASIETIQKDSMYKRIFAKIPAKAILIFTKAGFNPLGDLAIFGKNDSYNLAWVGRNKKEFEQLILKKSWPVIKHKTYNEVKLSNKLYLMYSWPLILLTNKSADKENAFFIKGGKKIRKSDLIHSKTKNCIAFGFFDPVKFLGSDLHLIPQKGRLFVGLKSSSKEIELFLVQPKVKLEGKMGIVPVKSSTNALFCWPINLDKLSEIKQVPDTVAMHLKELIKMPVNGVYGEILDTFSVSDRIITYDMDAEFKLTQKITFVYKTYPGWHLEFYKNAKETDAPAISQKTGLGLDILKLRYLEKGDRYVLTTDTSKLKVLEPNKKMPSYFVYVNVEKLKMDPFWKSYVQSNFKEVFLYADNLEKGSMFTFKLVK